MDILYILQVLWRRKWIILSIPIITAAAAFLLTMNAKPSFQSSARISTGFTDRDINVEMDNINIREADVKFSNLLTTMQSAINYNLASFALILHDLESADSSFRSPSKELAFSVTEEDINRAKVLFRQKLNNLEPLTPGEPNQDFLNGFLRAYGYDFNSVKGRTVIFRVPKTDYIQIDFVSENAYLSSYAVNAFTDGFIRYYKDLREASSGQSVEYFEQLADTLKIELDLKSKELEDFQSETTFIDPGTESSSKLTQIASLESEANELLSRIDGANLKIRSYTRQLNGTGGAVSDNSAVNRRITALTNQINEMNDRYARDGFRNKVLADSLTYLRALKQDEMLKLPSTSVGTEEGGLSKAELRAKREEANIERATAQSKLNRVRSSIAALKNGGENYAARESRINALTREIEVVDKEYRDAKDKLANAKSRRLASASSIKVVTRGTPALFPLKSKRFIIIGLAAFTTMALAVFAIVLLEIIDFSIKTPAQFKRMVGLNLWGSLNTIDTGALNFNELFSADQKQEELEVFKHFLRKLRFELENTNAQTFLVTSTKPNEGKSFVIFALSYALSLIKKRVLIIDTNFKNNSLTKLLCDDKENVKLLERGKEYEVLLLQAADDRESEPDDDDFYGSLVNATKYRNISIIGNAGGNDSPSEIISGRDFAELIHFLQENFDYIFMEGAALNDYSDTKELVNYAEKIIPVFSSESAIKQMDKESIAYLESLGKEGKLAGAILNKVENKNLKL